jgi:hypothetical protein
LVKTVHGQAWGVQCTSMQLAGSSTSIRGDHIVLYIYALMEMLSRPFHPDFVINMDESGFPSWPLKGTRKNCVFLQNSTVKLRFFEKRDANVVRCEHNNKCRGAVDLLMSIHPPWAAIK